MDRVTALGLVNLYPAVKAVPRAKLPLLEWMGFASSSCGPKAGAVLEKLEVTKREVVGDRPGAS